MRTKLFQSYLMPATRATEHPHPHLQTVLGNYAGLLAAMGQSPEQVRSALTELGQRYGMEFAQVGK